MSNKVIMNTSKNWRKKGYALPLWFEVSLESLLFFNG